MKPPLKEIELVAVGASIAAGCLPCTEFHQRAAENAGASQRERNAAVCIGLAARRIADEALRLRFDTSCCTADGDRNVVSASASVDSSTSNASQPDRRVANLINVAAAVALNNAAGLDTAIRSARRGGIGDGTLLLVAGLAARIKEKADTHLQASIAALDAPPGAASAAAHLCT